MSRAKFFCQRFAPKTFGTTTVTSLPPLILAGLYNIRTTDKQCAKQPCCRIAGICSAAMHATGSPLCACASASLTFYVLELPYERIRKAGNQEKTNATTRFEIA